MVLFAPLIPKKRFVFDEEGSDESEVEYPAFFRTSFIRFIMTDVIPFSQITLISSVNVIEFAVSVTFWGVGYIVYDCAYIEEDKINKKTNILEMFLIVIEISIFIFQYLEYDNWIFPSYFFQKKKIIIFLFVI